MVSVATVNVGWLDGTDRELHVAVAAGVNPVPVIVTAVPATRTSV